MAMTAYPTLRKNAQKKHYIMQRESSAVSKCDRFWRWHSPIRALLRGTVCLTEKMLSTAISKCPQEPFTPCHKADSLPMDRDRDILMKLDCWHRPKLGELPFRGLRIEEGWQLDSRHVVLPLAVTGFFLMVTSARLVYGDWGTAWNAGGFLVTLVTLLWMWVNHAIDT
jgi:hypothetical protein